MSQPTVDGPTLNVCAAPENRCTLAAPEEPARSVSLSTDVGRDPRASIKVSQLLKVAEKTVHTMAQKSELPAFEVGGQRRFRRADLNSWIDALTRRGDRRGAEGVA